MDDVEASACPAGKNIKENIKEKDIGSSSH
jgi:hypothetical protein